MGILKLHKRNATNFNYNSSKKTIFKGVKDNNKLINI